MAHEGRALVMGDGIAGLGAAIVLARAGWQVAVARPAARRASHRRHAHMTSTAVIRQLEHLTGGTLGGGWAMGDAAVWDECGRRDDAPRPVLCAEALQRALAARAQRLGVVWHDGVQLDPPASSAPAPAPAPAHWNWHAGGRSHHADLLVDASGSGHVLGRLPGVDVTIEELAGTDRCWSWVGENALADAPWLLACKGAASAAMLLRAPDGTLRLTVRDTARAVPDPAAALDRLMLGAGAAWLARLGTIALDARPLRHDSPLARRTLIAHPAALPPLVQIGDALLQTAPRLGQGIAQIAEQLAALAAGLGNGTPLSRLHAPAAALADRRWAGLAISASLGAGPLGQMAA